MFLALTLNVPRDCSGLRITRLILMLLELKKLQVLMAEILYLPGETLHGQKPGVYC